jgi:hypothetical protein
LATSNKNFKVKNGLDVNGEITAAAIGGDEGGQLNLAKPQTNTTLSGDVAIDIHQNKLRIFDKSGSNRGAYIDLSAAGEGVGTNLLAGGGGGSSLEVSETPPSSPSEGDIWYNSTSGQTFVYYDSYWVENIAGVAGPTGATGATGPAGADGADGATGPAGADGADGIDALWNFTGAWANGVDYDPGDVVEFNGSSYYAPVGIFSSYSPPNNGWLLVASKGDTGEAGADGADGADGATGPAGADGADGADSTVPGPQGDPGEQGDPGPGVAAGGTEGQVLLKVDGTDYNTTWADNSAESTFYLVRNNTGATITKGTLVAATGAEPSGRIDVAPFEVTGLENSELRVMGVATTNISNGVNGTVMSFGTLKGIDTRGDVSSAIAVGDETWAAGDILYAHPTVDGKLTKNKPQHDLVVAFITVRHATLGQMAIRITSGTHLEWLHDVAIEEPTDGDVLTYNSTNNVWENSQIDAYTTTEVDNLITPIEEDILELQEAGVFPIKLNEQTITANYSIPVGYNGLSAGPITIDDGVVVTVPSGSSWSIV